MGSASGMHPCSILPVYGATKSFLLQLSRSLSNAYPTSESGIVFHTLHPYFVRTPMTEDGPTKAKDLIKFGQKYIFLTPEEWVESALKVRSHLHK